MVFGLSSLSGVARTLFSVLASVPTSVLAFAWISWASLAYATGQEQRVPGDAAEEVGDAEEKVVGGDLSVQANGDIPLTRRERNVRVHIDGRLDEAAWRGLAVHDDFRLIDPDTLVAGELPTRVRMFYTERGFYLGAEMTQDSATLVEHLSGRDQGYLNRDYFSITLDTSGEGRYGFWFQLNLGNSVSDGTILPERQYSDSWDGAWWGATVRTEQGWSAEYFIPWSLVNMPKDDGARTIGIFAQRNIAHTDERYAWPPLPWTKPKFLSEFQPLGLREVSPRQQYSVTPYVSAAHDRFGDGAIEPKVGVDVLWRPSSNLQIASTLNPDFGNVEADDVVVNLSNYETFFPEKRLFFQEGQEIFAAGRDFGDTKLLHTRRIGGPAVLPETPDGVILDSEGLYRPADLLGAVKTTGQRGAWRYGFLGVMEEDSKFNASEGGTPLVLHQDGRDFGAFRALYEYANGGYRALGFMSTALRHPQRNATVNALDGQYTSSSGQLQASSQFIASDTDGDAEDGFGGFMDLRYAPRQGLVHYLSLDSFDDSIQLNDMGYQRRNDYRRVGYRMRLSSPHVNRFRNMRTYFRFDRMWNSAGKVVGADVSVDQRLVLHSLAQLRLSAGLRPSRYDDRASFGNGMFRINDAWEVELRYYSDSSRRLSYSVRRQWREETTGDGIYRRTQGRLRWRPTDRMTLGLGLRYADREAWLLHRTDGAFTTYQSEELMPDLDLSYFFTARQQLRLAFQWVAIRAHEQGLFRVPDQPGPLVSRAKQDAASSDDFAISQMNLQLRYRWEIAPLSDLFVVYTKNAAMPYADAVGRSFGDLLDETLAETTGENLVVKLRYRFGS